MDPDRRRGALSVAAAVILLAVVFLCRSFTPWADFYSLHIYPVLSGAVSLLFSWIPFSLEEILVVAASVYAVFCLVRIRKKWLNLVSLLLWIAVWFYAGWGVNYFRSGIFVRAGETPVRYEREPFLSFLSEYTASLESCLSDGNAPLEEKYAMEKDIKSFFTSLDKEWGLSTPKKWQHPKRLLFNRLYSAVGVSGFVGPFFNEIQVNGDVLPLQYAFTYAHELSHLMGVSSEAEANYWGFRSCAASSLPGVRLSAYQSLLPYVVSNARRVLPEEDYVLWLRSVPQEALNEMNAQSEYWSGLYSPVVGSVQDWIYNLYLKGNRISGGTADYSEVIRILMTLGVGD